MHKGMVKEKVIEDIDDKPGRGGEDTSRKTAAQNLIASEQPEDNNDISEDKKKKRDRLASSLTGLARQLINSGELDRKTTNQGAKPVTAYRTRAEMIVAQNAPLAAAIQAGMLRGTIPPDDTIVRLCDSVLDRIMGKARQQIDVFANSEGLKRLDAYATWLQVQRGEPPQVISAEVKELPERSTS